MNGYVVLPETRVDNPLADKVDHFRTYDINWFISADGGITELAAGTSKNEMFVTLAIPEEGVLMYVTPVWLFAAGAKGARDQDAAIRGAFSMFETQAVKTHLDVDPLRAATDPAVEMHYYKNWAEALTLQNFVSMMQSHVAYKDGQCTAWTDFFVQTLVEGGIRSRRRYTQSGPACQVPLRCLSKHGYLMKPALLAIRYIHTNYFDTSCRNRAIISASYPVVIGA